MTESLVYCYSFSGSYETEVCYTFSPFLPDTCSITVEGTTCNSCEKVTCNATATGAEDTDKNVWDCTNVAGGKQGSQCNEGDSVIPFTSFETFCLQANSTNPDGTSGVPNATSAVPNATSAVPNATSAVPNATSVPSATSAAPNSTSVPSATSAVPTEANAPSSAPVEAEEVDSEAPTPPPITPPVPPVTNAPVVDAAAAPQSTSGSGYYGTGSSSVWIVLSTSLVAGMAIALGATSG